MTHDDSSQSGFGSYGTFGGPSGPSGSAGQSDPQSYGSDQRHDPWASSSYGGGTATLAPPVAAPAAAPRGKRPVRLVAATALLAAALGGGAGAATAALVVDGNGTSVSATSTQQSGGISGTTVSLPQGSTAAVAKAVLPSVVQIEERTSSGGGTGSGIILRGDGYILTNNHVVAGVAQGGELRVTLNDGRKAPAKVVGTDPGADLAVIKVDGLTGLTPIKIGRSADLQVGESVVAVGSPLGLAGTVTEGIVSSLNRPVATGGSDGSTRTVLNAIQTDTAINPGNSGGALVNMRGELVGINSAIASLGSSGGGQSGSIGLGFAIPVDQAKRIANELIATGTATHALLGSSVGDAPDGGATLESVQSGSAADKAGLQQGDVVTKFGTQQVDSADSLVAAVRSSDPGSKVALTYVRNGKTATVSVTLGSATAS